MTPDDIKNWTLSAVSFMGALQTAEREEVQEKLESAEQQVRNLVKANLEFRQTNALLDRLVYDIETEVQRYLHDGTKPKLTMREIRDLISEYRNK
jgi:hypothetical protein